jgi:hypothetical protein
VVDCTDPESVLAGLGADIDLGPVLARQQLDVRTPAETYLREGEFSTDRMLEFWDQTIGEALSDEFGLVRGVGEMTWASRALPDVVGYEARLNRFLPRYPQIFLCMYEVARFSGDVLVDILKVHPKVLLGSTVIENPYYIEPDEFLAARQ